MIRAAAEARLNCFSNLLPAHPFAHRTTSTTTDESRRNKTLRQQQQSLKTQSASYTCKCNCFYPFLSGITSILSKTLIFVNILRITRISVFQDRQQRCIKAATQSTKLKIEWKLYQFETFSYIDNITRHVEIFYQIG